MMTEFTLTQNSNSSYSVKGDLTFFSIDKKAIKSFDFLKSAQTIQIDLANVNSADSAGLALIIEWIKQSKLYSGNLRFSNMPKQLLILAHLSDFEINQYITDKA